MGKGWKIGIGLVTVVAVALIVNSIVVRAETKTAEITVPGGRLLDLPDGEMQVLDSGPPGGSPIVLIHCYTCAIDWWDRITPPLVSSGHRVIAVDLRGYGGSEKPSSGYSMADQANFVAEALRRLGVRGATVVGQSLGGTVATALAERSPRLVRQVVIVDQAPDESYGEGLPFIAQVSFLPMIGEALWQVTPDFAVKEGLGVAFAPGFDVPDAFVEDFNRMTYTSYTADDEEGDYSDAVPLDRRLARTGKPLLAIFGAQDQLYDSKRALAAYSNVPGAATVLVPGAGHSPNVERPARTAAAILGFLRDPAHRARFRQDLQKGLQTRETVRQRP